MTISRLWRIVQWSLRKKKPGAPGSTTRTQLDGGNAKDVARALVINQEREREQREDGDEAIVVANDASQLATRVNELSVQSSGYSEFNKSWKMDNDDTLRQHAYWVESRRAEGLDP